MNPRIIVLIALLDIGNVFAEELSVSSIATAESPAPSETLLDESEAAPHDSEAPSKLPDGTGNVSPAGLFYKMGKNWVCGISYQHGLFAVGVIAGTWLCIESGLDWRWNRFFHHNEYFARAGLSALYLGYAIPVLIPLSLYISGHASNNSRIQLTGLAAAQAVMLTFFTSTLLKGISGRSDPGIISELNHQKNPSRKDFSRDFSWGKMEFIRGWPSNHTATAFAVAAVIAEFYTDSMLIKVCSYAGAALIGLGVSFNVHWFSEVIAGMFIGVAMGKSVSKSFIARLNNENTAALKSSGLPFSVIITPHFAGIRIRTS